MKIADKQMVITPCEFERAKIDVQFAFDSAGRISGLVFRPAASAAVPYTLPSYANPVVIRRDARRRLDRASGPCPQR